MDPKNEMFIFIVEDDSHFRETFSDVMSLRGVKVSGAGTAEEALKALKTQTPSVIVVDVRLPDMHGFDLCRRLRRMPGLQKTPVMLLSGVSRYNDPRDRVEGLLSGAAAFLVKPITIEDLWAQICAVLGRPATEFA